MKANLTVAEPLTTAEVRAVLEGSFPLLWVEGEISNLAMPRSGHLYFSLKDAHAQVRCAMFKNRKRLLGFKPQNGQQIMARVRVSLYEGRGEYQLIVEHLEEKGEGDLRRAFDALKQKLQGEGLFELERKQTIPAPPQHLGVITSPTGAAIHDILSVLSRRHPGLPVTIYPTAVQGDSAPGEIISAITRANRRKECDLLLLTRGGGSMEDLWAFNDEGVARAIANSKLPIVSAVGHEVDFTIADFVADLRAPTPSAAAEQISLDSEQLLTQLQGLKRRLSSAQRNMLSEQAQELRLLAQRLQHQHPGRVIQSQNQLLDELDQHLRLLMRQQLGEQRHLVDHFAQRLARYSPSHRVKQLSTRQRQLSIRLKQGMEHCLSKYRDRLRHQGHNLNTVSPLATLGRGYAIVTRNQDGAIVREAREAEIGEEITARLGKGQLTCRVESQQLED